MKMIDFPVFKTKSPADSPEFDLNNPKERAKYFQLKAGPEIAKIREYLETRTFLGIFLGKKGSGKGTYSKFFEEAIGSGKIVHISAGDIVRGVDQEVADPKSRKGLIAFLRENYRGWISPEKLIETQLNRSTKKLLPTEFVLALIKREIGRQGKKAIFLDGFPRELDQVSYSLFFRELVDYRDDPDFFILIDIPEKVIDERIKTRVVCPRCQTSRNLKLLPTSKVEYDAKAKKFYLICDNPECSGAKMTPKEGDELGLEPIRKRLQTDEELIKRAFDLHGIPKILLRNAVPIDQAKEMVDEYEITPEFVHLWDEKGKKIVTDKRPWVFDDDRGRRSVSLLAPPVAIALIKQVADLL